MTSALGWLADRIAGAPPRLADRARSFLAGVPAEGAQADRLAAAAVLALGGLPADDRSRAAALDLLSADSLITLALLAQAEESPAELARFAERIVSAASA